MTEATPNQAYFPQHFTLPPLHLLLLGSLFRLGLLAGLFAIGW
jgi:hypothetical protein